MASTITTNSLRVNVALRTYVDNPADASAARNIAWVDMRYFARFMATVVFVSGTGVLTFRIMASAAVNGSNPVEVKVHSVPTAADAAGDQLVLECSVDELNSLGTDLRYLSVELDCDHADDICAVTYLRTNPRFSSSTELTADVIA